MMSNIVTIMKKEFARFFKDKRMVFTTIFMPGLMIYILYSFMGEGMSTMYQSEDGFIPQIDVVNLPDSMLQAGDSLGVKLQPTNDPKAIKQALQTDNAKSDLLMVFPADFDQQVAAYDVSDNVKAPEIELYYNSTVTDSTTAYTTINDALDKYETTLSNKFDINSQEKKYDLASDKDLAGRMFASILPLLMTIFIFSGCMAVAPESIAGEKERGTIATLLVTPIKRSSLAMGKIISLSVIAIISGCSSFLGVVLSLPKMMGSDTGLNAGVYQAADYTVILAVILSTVLVIISLISIISAYAKNVKEATTYVMPLMIVNTILGVTTMIESFKPTTNFMYLIPLYNSVNCLTNIFSFNFQPIEIVITVVSNIVYTAIFVGILAKMFDNENIMFSK
jgi:sodium transport system permease protein